MRGFLVSIVWVSAVVLAGCAGMADTASKIAGLGVVSKQRSTFDDSTIVQVTPTWLYAKGSWGNRVKLGARWSSASPDVAALVLSYDSSTSGAGPMYVGLSGIDVNIDGAITSYSANSSTDLGSSNYNTVSKTIYTQSSNAVVIPYSILQSMVSAKDCRLRIHTSKGYEDAEFSIERIPGGQGTAILSIREFIAEVEAAKGQR